MKSRISVSTSCFAKQDWSITGAVLSSQNKVIKTYVDKFKTSRYTQNISTTWTGDSAPYTQNLSVLGVDENSIVDVSLASTASKEQVKAYNALNLQDGGQSVGQITLKAFGAKNTVAIPINVIVRGEA